MAAVDRFGTEECERPRATVGDAILRVTRTTICGTNVYIVRGEYPVEPGLGRGAYFLRVTTPYGSKSVKLLRE